VGFAGPGAGQSRDAMKIRITYQNIVATDANSARLAATCSCGP